MKARSASETGSSLFRRSDKLVLISLARSMMDPCAGLLHMMFRGVSKAS